MFERHVVEILTDPGHGWDLPSEFLKRFLVLWESPSLCLTPRLSGPDSP